MSTSPWRQDVMHGRSAPYLKPPKLTPAQRDEIRARLVDGESPQALALEFGVSASLIRKMR